MPTIPIDIIAIHSYDYFSLPSTQLIYVTYDFADYALRGLVTPPTVGAIVTVPSNPSLGRFSTPLEMATYYFSTYAAGLIADLNSAQTIFTYTVGNLITTDEDTQLIINMKQTQHPNLDKVSAATYSAGGLFRINSGNIGVDMVSMHDFMAGLMNSASGGALASGIGLAAVSISGAYADLSGKPTIPTLTSQLTNDSGYITSAAASSVYVAKTTTVNGHALSSNVTVTKTDVGLSNVPNLDTSTSANITDSTNKRFVTDAQQTVIGNTSGTNTGDQTSVTGNAGTATKLQTARTINGVNFDGSANITLPLDITVYNGTATVSNPKIIQKTGSVSSGTAIFQLTADNTSTGTALLTNVHSVNVDINSSAASYGYSWALSNSNKTLTVTVVQPGSLLGLGLVPFVSASNGVVVNVRVYGN